MNACEENYSLSKNNHICIKKPGLYKVSFALIFEKSGPKEVRIVVNG
jgi:hypothetical protein